MRAGAFVVTAVLVLAGWAAGGVSAAPKPRRACAPPGTRVLASNRFGAVYRERGNYEELISCEAGRTYRASLPEGAPQFFSLDIGGHFYAYPASISDDADPEGVTNIVTEALSARRQPALTILGSAPPVSVLVDVTKLRLAANQALVWIACEGAFGFGRLLPQCVRDGRRRWLYARPASASFDERFVPKLIATGRHIDARFLRFSTNGRIVTWRQQGKLKRKDIGP